MVTTSRALRAPAIRYRAARRTDVETLAELAARAYRVSSIEKRREFYTDHPRFSLRDVRVAELDGEIVASLALYPLTAYVRGQTVPVTGVGSVAVSPEHRRRGVGETLLRSALREMRQRGSHLSALYAFKGAYYRKLGYGVCETVHQLAISAANLPASDEARRVRRLMLPDRSAVQALYDRVASQGHFALARRPEWWTQRLWTYPGDWVVYEGRRRGQIEGYLYYEVETSHGPFRLAVTLGEFVAATPEAHRGLVGHIASLADQVEEIHFAAPADGAWLTVLKTSQNLRPGAEIAAYLDTGGVGSGAMFRICDVKAALEMLPVVPWARGEVALEVEDRVLPQNSRTYRVIARDGRLRVAPYSGRRAPRIGAPVDVLAQIVAGALTPTRAAEVGLIASTHDAAEITDGWFRARPAFLYPFNLF
ncbi:MAG: GNAT family N-acetyltransferase [Candidatus Eisenbacteria bacterium]|uniref:GNAT family N-acetyltransferase n=1 Tax=Eiseniibacteriota bacterium TaxID=2212470 RepID=A0A9D6L8V1_UNCEI|nr:GNAT family N-acetyltransferase [Candidatus Eisenbacteria bacterium]MBI3540004.1 GNAT family N-acetyltransferase [Candidatus Eisenbacteria bacterium]